MGTDSPSKTFWTYWSAGTISAVGSGVTAVAMPLVAVTVLDATAFQVGVLAAASYVAWLVIGLPAGVIVGRLPLRGTQVAMDLVRAAALASVPLAWWWELLTLPHLVLVALVVSFANVLFDVGNLTLLPAIVPKSELNRRNSLMSGTHAATQTGGPSLGGLLVQVLGAVPTVLVDAVSYLASAVLMARLPRRDPERPAVTTPAHIMIREGWRYVTRHPGIGPCMWAATVLNFICGALLALAPLYLVRELHAPPGLVGLLIATDGVGALIGSAVTPWLSRRFGTARAMLVAGGFGAVSALLMPAASGAPGMLLFAVGNAGFAVGIVVFSINTRTYRMTESPPDLLSRVLATVRFVSWGALPFGAVVAGAVASRIGIREALWLTAAADFVPLVQLWFSQVRTVRDLDEITVAAEPAPALD